MSIDTTTIILGSLIVGLVVGNFFYEASAEPQPVANEVANNTANRVTTIETEVYRVVCVEEKSGYCKEYSVRRVNRE